MRSFYVRSPLACLDRAADEGFALIGRATFAGSEHPQRVDPERGSGDGMDQSEDTEDDRNDASPGLSRQQSVAGQQGSNHANAERYAGERQDREKGERVVIKEVVQER
jgi:hypothetical protein